MNKADLPILAIGTDCMSKIAGKLNNLGYNSVARIDDGVSAWDYLKKNRVEVVFADYQLGQFDGLVLIKLMSADKNLADIPVILACPTINRDLAIDAGRAGVSSILVEPFDEDIINEKMDILFDAQEMERDTEADTLIETGKTFIETGDYSKALDSFNKILELYENPEVYYNIGYIKASQKKYDESILAFRKAIKIDQKFAQAFRALGEVYSKIGLKDKAEEMMERAGELYMEKNMTLEAESAFNEVLKMNPNTTNIYNSLGILYRRTEKYDKAVEAYEKALKVDPRDENIFFNLGRAYYESGIASRARQCLEKALEIFPEFKEAEIMLQTIEKKTKKQ